MALSPLCATQAARPLRYTPPPRCRGRLTRWCSMQDSRPSKASLWASSSARRSACCCFAVRGCAGATTVVEQPVGSGLVAATQLGALAPCGWHGVLCVGALRSGGATMALDQASQSPLRGSGTGTSLGQNGRFCRFQPLGASGKRGGRRRGGRQQARLVDEGGYGYDSYDDDDEYAPRREPWW